MFALLCAVGAAGNRLVYKHIHTLSSNDQETDWFCVSALALIALVPRHQTLPEKLHHRPKEGRRVRKEKTKTTTTPTTTTIIPCEDDKKFPQLHHHHKASSAR